MKTDFDFDRIGKREPYKVPDNFFRCLEDGIMIKAAPSRRRFQLPWRIILTGAMSAAVAAAVLIAVVTPASQRIPSYEMDDVERIFARLSEADQNYLLETYQDDIFINP